MKKPFRKKSTRALLTHMDERTTRKMGMTNFVVADHLRCSQTCSWLCPSSSNPAICNTILGFKF
jgi:hypothetical protein